MIELLGHITFSDAPLLLLYLVLGFAVAFAAREAVSRLSESE